MFPFRKPHKWVQRLYGVLQSEGFTYTHIIQMEQHPQYIEIILLLPDHKDVNDFINIIPNIQQSLNALDARIANQRGKRITIQLGTNNINPLTFNETMIKPGTLQIALPNTFGTSIIDFEDGASCHMLNGGTTRMGKTSLLLYLATVLYLQNPNQIHLYITSTKIKDYYPFINIPNVHLSKSEPHLLHTLLQLKAIYLERDHVLNSPPLRTATDAKSAIKQYPAYAHHFQPIFLIIDEYARFSESKEIQSALMELVETAGYVNIHIILSTQRPDARTVLSPRIKANLLLRLCFTTADQNNSIVILDQPGAESLGRIQGRALLLDSHLTTVQVPYLSPEESDHLLNPYRKEDYHGVNHQQEQTGSTDQTLSRKIQNLFKESDSSDFL